MAREPEPIVERRRALGAQLATFRQAAELTQGQLGKIIHCDRTTVAHTEKGRNRGDKNFWEAADKAVQADGALLARFYEVEISKQEHDQQQQATHLADVREKTNAWRASRPTSLNSDETDRPCRTEIARHCST